MDSKTIVSVDVDPIFAVRFHILSAASPLFFDISQVVAVVVDDAMMLLIVSSIFLGPPFIHSFSLENHLPQP